MIDFIGIFYLHVGV